MVDIICLQCSKSFRVSDYRASSAKYCSTRCYSTRKITDETRKRMSDSAKGKIAWNKGVQMWKDREHPRGTLGMKLKKRKPLTLTARKRMSESHKGLKYPTNSGENNHFWKGGVTSLHRRMRKSSEFRLWREAVFKRDKYTCQKCNGRTGDGNVQVLHPHHIKPLSEFHELAYDVDNGITLCKDCHRKEHEDITF